MWHKDLTYYAYEELNQGRCRGKVEELRNMQLVLLKVAYKYNHCYYLCFERLIPREDVRKKKHDWDEHR